MRSGRLVALVATLALACGLVAATATPAAGAPNTATVVIDTGSNVRTVTISFSQSSITGLQALQLAGANPVTRPYGPGLAVCVLDGVGRAGTDCLGTPQDPRYWAYFRAPAGSSAWSYSSAGSGATQVRNGDWEGWRYGTGQRPRATPSAPRSPAPSPPAPAPNRADAGSSGDRAEGSNPSGSDAGSEAAVRGDRRGSPTAGTSDRGGRDAEARDDADAAGDAGDRAEADADDARTRGEGGSSGEDPDDVRAAAAIGEQSESSGGGSPLGVLVALGVAAAFVAAAFVMHRRRSAATGSLEA